MSVTLTDCAGLTLASAITDGSGAYSMAISAAQAGQDVCLVTTPPSNYVATGANVSSVQMPNGVATSAGGVSHTDARSLQQVKFVAPSNGVQTVNFGMVPVSTLIAASNKQGMIGTNVVHPHVFTAGTGGTLQVSLGTTVSTPATPGWNEVVYLDSTCGGAIQPGMTKLHPPTASITVIQGQVICFIVREFIPANAGAGNNNFVPVTATLVFNNATSPTLSTTYTVTYVTSVNMGSLQFHKEVRNVTLGDSFGSSNQAKSGDTLEYRITYTNIGNTSIGGLEIADSVSTYATFVSAAADTLPAALTACTKNTPVNPAPIASVGCTAAQTSGGSGVNNWTFAGQLTSNISGSVRFIITIN